MKKQLRKNLEIATKRILKSLIPFTNIIIKKSKLIKMRFQLSFKNLLMLLTITFKEIAMKKL